MNEFEPEKPPIPSPFVEPAAAAPAAPSQTGNYVIVVLLALVAVAVHWLLVRAVGVWPVAVLALGFYFIGAIAATLQVARAGQAMGWRVRGADLHTVRRVVDTNMKCAYLVMTAIWPFMAVALLEGEPEWAFPVMLFSIPFSLWSTGIEKKFKAMEAEPDAAAGYRALIEAWKEARFGLKKESTA